MPIVQLLLCELLTETNVRFSILPYGNFQLKTKEMKLGNDSRSSFAWSFTAACLSVICILATIIVYVSLPDLQNTHGKSLLGYLCSSLIAYTVLAGVQLHGSNYVQPLQCSMAGYLIYFGFLSSFLWLNIISIDLWLNFR